MNYALLPVFGAGALGDWWLVGCWCVLLGQPALLGSIPRFEPDYAEHAWTSCWLLLEQCLPFRPIEAGHRTAMMVVLMKGGGPLQASFTCTYTLMYYPQGALSSGVDVSW